MSLIAVDKVVVVNIIQVKGMTLKVQNKKAMMINLIKETMDLKLMISLFLVEIPYALTI